MRSIIFVIIFLLPTLGFSYQRSKTCLDATERNPLAPSAAPTCTGNQIGKAFHWNKLLIPYYVHENGPKSFPNKNGEYDPRLFTEIQKSFQAWEDVSCAKLAFRFAGFTKEFGHKSDKKNWVGFYAKNWPHSKSAIAVTTVTTRLDGTMTDADIEINAENTQFGIRGEPEKMDFRNFLTHEVGHLIGLDHSPNPAATMQYNTPPGETYKRSLHEDDIEGICAIYPLGFEPEEEPTEDTGCCSTTKSHSPSLFGLFFVLGLTFIRRKFK